MTRLKVFKFDQLPTEALFDGKFTRTAIRSEHSIVMLNWLTPDYPRQLPHRHPFDQLSFVFAGTLIFEIEGERYEMPPMSAILVPPNALHTAWPKGDEVVLNVGPVALVGNSLGGRDPARRGHEGTGAGLPSRSHGKLRPSHEDHEGPAADHQLRLHARRHASAGPVSYEPGFAVDEGVIEYRYRRSLDLEIQKSYEAIMAWVRNAGGLYYPEDALSQIETPTLVINGKDDQAVPIATAVRFLELLPNSWGYFIPHCGHWAVIERPRDFADAVIRFVKETATTAMN